MKEKEYQDGLREVTFYFLSAPAIILIGMAVIGIIIDSLSGTTNTFSKIFVYIGGIPGIGMYYYKMFNDLKKSKLQIKKG